MLGTDSAQRRSVERDRMLLRGPQMADQTASVTLIAAILQRSDVEATTVRCLRAWLTGVLRVSP
jgi:hypothetical protein